MATVDAMQQANKAMKKQYKGIDIDKIEVSWLVFRYGAEQQLMDIEHTLRYGRYDRAGQRDSGVIGQKLWCTG